MDDQQGQKAGGVANAVGGAIGVAVGLYAGVQVLFALVGALVVAGVASLFLDERRKPMLRAVAVQGGHTLWMVVGFVMLGMFDWRAADVMLMGVLVVWLAAWPGRASVVCLTLLQAFGFVVNLWAFMQADAASLPHKALLVHLALRAFGVAAMWVALPKVQDRWDKPKGEAVPPPEPGSPLGWAPPTLPRDDEREAA